MQNCRRPESPTFPKNGWGRRCISTIRALPGRRDGRNKPKHQRMRLSVSRNMAWRKATRPTRRTSVRCSTIVTTARQQKTQVVMTGSKASYVYRLHRAVTPVLVYTGYGLVHGSITLDQEDFPHLQFPLDLRCEWTNSNGCIPFECYVNGMPNDLTCWQTCPDPCFSIKKCNTFSKECTCQGFPVDLTYVPLMKTTTTAKTTTTTTTPAHTTSTTTPVHTTTTTTPAHTTTSSRNYDTSLETTTPVPTTPKLQELTTSTPVPSVPETPVDDHLQTCPCHPPPNNPSPADRSCRDLETRDTCKVSYNKRKEDPPPPLICNWHQAKGCIPWSCSSTV